MGDRTMDNLEMMIGYETNFFEKKFNENDKKLGIYMYNCLKQYIGDKISALSVEENLLQAWAYYFIEIADENPKAGDRVMANLITHFRKLMEDKENVKIQGEATTKLMLDPSFCRIWFGTSLNVMLVDKYGLENYKHAFEVIQREFLEKETKVKVLALT